MSITVAIMPQSPVSRRHRRRLDLVIAAVRQERTDPDAVEVCASGDHLMLVLPQDGTLHEGGKEPLGLHEVLVLAPGSSATLTVGPRSRWQEISLAGRFAVDLSAVLPRRCVHGDPAWIAAHLEALQRPETAARSAARLLLGLAVGAGDPLPGVPVVATARRLVRLAGAREVDVRRVADQVGTSVSHLHRLYQRHFGISPLRDARRHLMVQAQVALRQTTISCQELSGVLGYDDPLYFSAVFRRVVGCSPRAWRRQVATGQELARA
jgi:AraC-like DNA-binding protein